MLVPWSFCMAVCRKKDDASCKEKNMNVGSTCGQWRCYHGWERSCVPKQGLSNHIQIRSTRVGEGLQCILYMYRSIQMFLIYSLVLDSTYHCIWTNRLITIIPQVHTRLPQLDNPVMKSCLLQSWVFQHRSQMYVAEDYGGIFAFFAGQCFSSSFASWRFQLSPAALRPQENRKHILLYPLEASHNNRSPV